MNFSDIYGQQRAIEQITTALSSSRIHHALLFTGPDGVGKRTLATLVAQRLLCKNPSSEGPCNLCGSCVRFVENAHADFLVLGLERKSDGSPEKMIKVDQIRGLQKKLALKPFEGGGRVVLITDAERMNPSTANALLKTLEEPPPDTVFLLTSNAPNALLPTVVSRCQSLRLAPLSSDALRRIAIREIEQPLELVDQAIESAEGSISRLFRFLDPDAMALRARCFERIEALRTGAGAGAVIQYAEQDAADKKRTVSDLMLDFLQAWYRRALVSRYSGETSNHALEIQQNLTLRSEDIVEFLSLIDNVRQGIASNQRNVRLAMEEVWFFVEAMEKRT
ncbi:MAG: DNA polymerase III subunit delta' [Bradymonadia bacterium]